MAIHRTENIATSPRPICVVLDVVLDIVFRDVRDHDTISMVDLRRCFGDGECVAELDVECVPKGVSELHRVCIGFGALFRRAPGNASAYGPFSCTKRAEITRLELEAIKIFASDVNSESSFESGASGQRSYGEMNWLLHGTRLYTNRELHGRLGRLYQYAALLEK